MSQQTDCPVDYQMSDDYLLGCGHPLLDISLGVDDKFLTKFNLKPDDAILAKPEHSSLIDYLFAEHLNELKLISGGATMNSTRTAQWVFNFYDKKQTYFLGSVGDDKYSKLLEEQVIKDEVVPLFCKIRDQVLDANNNLKDVNQKESKMNEKKLDSDLNAKSDNIEIDKEKKDCFKTGVCLAFNSNNGQNRSMITFLGAAKQLDTSHLNKFMDKLAKSKIVYCGGFLLSSSYEVVSQIGQYCYDNGKKFALNLSAPYVCNTFGNLIAKLILDLDLIFCNESELRVFANYHKFGTDNLQEIAMKIFDTFPCRKKEQLITVTQNKDAVLCFMRSNRLGLSQYVPKINKEDIVDTIGAGDSFSGGFLAYYLMNKDIDLCLKCGIYCAREIIKKNGCNFDNIKFDERSLIELFNPKSC